MGLKGIKPVIINNFDCIDDIADYCMASSHIPFITGKMFCKIDKNLFVDGGLFGKRVINKINPYFCITSNMWGFDFKKFNILSLRTKDLKHFKEFYYNGYEDSYNNKKILDKYFISL